MSNKLVDTYFSLHARCKDAKAQMDAIGEAIKDAGLGEHFGDFAVAKVIKPADSSVFNYKLGYEMVLVELGKMDPQLAVALRKKAEKRFTETRGNALIESREIQAEDLPFEFMLNALRLTDGVDTSTFGERTGLPLSMISKGLDEASKKGLLDSNPSKLKATDQGLRYLNNLQEIFLG